MMGHTTTRMLYERYGKFIKNRIHQDGSAYLKALNSSLETDNGG